MGDRRPVAPPEPKVPVEGFEAAIESSCAGFETDNGGPDSA